MTHLLFRVVLMSSPTLEDFKSHRALGRRLRDPTMEREWAEGISVFDSRDRAMAVARATRYKIGRFVVPLLLPDDGSIEVAKTGLDPHHFTLYGKPSALMALVSGPAEPMENS